MRRVNASPPGRGNTPTADAAVHRLPSRRLPLHHMRQHLFARRGKVSVYLRGEPNLTHTMIAKMR